MFATNLLQLRKINRMTQEELAARVGVTRQAVAKWEAGDSVPDLATGQKLAEVFGVSLDELVQFDAGPNTGLAVPPRGKYLFGVVTVGEKGQIIIPARARKIFGIEAGTQLVILGEEGQGLAVMKADDFLHVADAIRRMEENK
ncbi:MAG: helix-turn-helix domain-containing protein [Firmicutes bacterium]|nr:helix-turn-helix domain-containing protein [Bacillota bacterium]